MDTFTLEQKKAIALAISQGVYLFIEDGRVWIGNRDDVFAAYEEWASEKGAAARFSEWLDEEGEEMPEYEEHNSDTHRVLTDEEADEKAAEYIKESLWAFRPEFLASYCGDGIDADTIRAIQANDRCEDNNPVFLRLVGDNLEDLIDAAISSDGRGHFLNTYDGEEEEVNLYDVTGRNEYLYVIRVN